MKIIYFTKRPLLCYPIIIPKTALGFIGMFGSTHSCRCSSFHKSKNVAPFSFLLEKRLEFRALGAFFLP